ncbi:MAG TPA: hypothetical protein DCY07_05020 [Rhodospirillaceae bacterium]|nr:hypothetical protein [Rhodospirillaceae bacterium]
MTTIIYGVSDMNRTDPQKLVGFAVPGQFDYPALPDNQTIWKNNLVRVGLGKDNKALKIELCNVGLLELTGFVPFIEGYLTGHGLKLGKRSLIPTPAKDEVGGDAARVVLSIGVEKDSPVSPHIVVASMKSAIPAPL